MTTPSPVARGTEINIDGLGQFPVAIQGNVDLVNAVTNGLPHLIPWRGRIKCARVRVRTAPGTAAGVVQLGTTADADKFSAGVTIPTTASAGDMYDLPLDGVAGSLVSANDVVVLTGDGGATSTGDVDVFVVIAPEAADS